MPLDSTPVKIVEAPLDDPVIEVLERVYKRLSKRGAWTYGAYARDAEGRSIGDLLDGAVRWCLVGAIRVETLYRTVYSKVNVTPSDCIIRLGFLNDTAMVTWNDECRNNRHRSQREVLSKLRWFIDNAKAGELLQW